MAEKVLETLISVTDKFSAPILKFEKQLQHVMVPVDNLKKGLRGLDRVTGFAALRSGLAGLQKHSREALQSITNLGTGIGLIFGAAGFAIAKINKSVLKLNDIEGGADLFGISVESFQKIEYAAKVAGVSMETIGNGLKKMTIAASANHKVFSAVGLNAKQIAKGVVSAEDVILQLSKKFAENGYSAAQKIQIATAMFGKSGTEVIALLNEGQDAIKGWFDERKSIGLMDDKQAAAAKAYVKNLNMLKADVDAIVTNIGVKFLPELDKLVKSLSAELVQNKEKYIDAFDKLKDSLPKFVDSVVKNMPKIFDALGRFLDFIGYIIDKVGVVKPAVILAFGGIIVPLLGIIKSIVMILKMPAKLLFSLFTFVAKAMPKFVGAFRFAIPALKGFGIAFRAALGPIGIAYIAFEYLWPIIKKIPDLFDKIAEHWAELDFSSIDGIIHSFGKLRDITVEWLDSIGKAGTIIKWIGNIGNKIFGNKADFSSVPVDSIAESMKNVPSAGDVGDSDLFRSVTSTKTINNNSHSYIDVNFNNVPKGVEIKRRLYGDPAKYGFSMSPAF